MNTEDTTRGAVFVLPDGGALGGVTSWAVITMQALSAGGWRTAVVGPGVGQKRWPPGVLTLDAGPTLGSLRDGIGHAVSQLHDASPGGLVVLPQLSGIAYAAASSALDATRQPNQAIVGWVHANIRHDIELIRRFAPCLARIVCVSRAAEQALVDAGVSAPGSIAVIPTGTDLAGDDRASRAPTVGPLRMLYVGRLDAFQKRVLSLPRILERLRNKRCGATLSIVGDGPARDQLDSTIEQLGVQHATQMHGARPRSDLPAFYRSHDLLLQPSRSEGLGIARIEAALHGCVPVVTPGGSSEGLRDGVDGIVVAVDPEEDDQAAAEGFAEAIAARSRSELCAMSPRAARNAREAFSFDRYADRVRSGLGAATSTDHNRRAWSAVARDPERAAAFTVPDDLEARIACVLPLLPDHAIALHGAGAHTRAAWPTMMRMGVRVGLIADDDAERWGGSMLGVPVVRPEDVPPDAGTVLISSWLHEDAVWSRRSVYERIGLRVVRLYGPARAGTEEAIG